ncbi:MAG TPA: PQQ-dependent sugar dehydrogenase [Candidatus Thermoplasmatota archaeon]|nr:PQQ-dependent sugar dehydrogenase [Candidatus Thermoplasmatota archaeon]
MRRALPLALLAAVLLVPAAGAQAAFEGAAFARGLAFPVDVVFGPDGTLYYAELNTGAIRAIPPGETAPRAEPVHKVAAAPGGNGGFLGLALDPEFERTKAFFVYYTAKIDGTKVNRVSRLDASGEKVILDGIPWAEMHDGGRLLFVGDHLVVVTGDNERREVAQDLGNLLGKTLRMTRDGAGAPGNPFPNHPLVYTYGHRNPFGLAWDPASSTLWQTENGPEKNDEVNILVAGKNYGWPRGTGALNDPRFEDPVHTYATTLGPTGATVLNGTMYFGEFNAGAVHRVRRASDGSVTADVVWRVPGGGRVLDVEAGPDRRLYVSTYDAIHVVTVPGERVLPLPNGTPAPNGTEDPPGGNTTAPPPDEAGPALITPTPGPALGALALAAGAVAAARRRRVPRRGRGAAAALLVVAALATPAAAAAEPEVVATDLETPVDLTFAPDGTLHFAELLTGRVRAIGPDGVVTEPVFSIPASGGGNGGFTGLAADPVEAGVFYVHYSMEKPGAERGKVNRISRVANGVETVLVDDIPWAMLHDGGRVAVGPDGILWATTGDNDLKSPSQDRGSILGKVLRFTKEGKPAPGNPDGWHPLAWAQGFRNPFGLAVTGDTVVYVSDNGGREEVNRVEKGANHGWPHCTGACGRQDFAEPVAWWDEHFGPTGIAVADGTLYLGDYVNGRVRAVDLATGAKTVFWERSGARVLDVERGPDGCLYVAGWTTVWRFALDGATCGARGSPGGNTTKPPPDGNATGSPDSGGPASIVPTPAPGLALAALAALAGARLARRRA